MKNRFIFVTLLIVGSLFGCSVNSPTEEPGFQSDNSLLAQLQQGGYVIFFRHAATDHSQKDTDFDQCASQRNLNETGRNQAIAIGKHFSEKRIPIGEVRSSRLCRALDTGKLAFERAIPMEDLTSIVAVSPQVRVQRAEAIKRMLAEPPKKRKNTVLVSHKHMFHDASRVWLDEGEAAIYKPDGQGGTTLITTVKVDDWERALFSPIE